MDGYEWGPAKAAANLRKHKVRFADAALSLEDPKALIVRDPDARDLGCDPEGRVLVTVYAHRGEHIRIISARRASPGERRRYEEK